MVQHFVDRMVVAHRKILFHVHLAECQPVYVPGAKQNKMKLTEVDTKEEIRSTLKMIHNCAHGNNKSEKSLEFVTIKCTTIVYK